MPVILQDEGLEAWLSPTTDMKQLTEMLKPCPEDALDFYPVEAKLLNSSQIDTPECVDKIDFDVQSLLKTDSPSIPTQELPF